MSETCYFQQMIKNKVYVVHLLVTVVCDAVYGQLIVSSVCVLQYTSEFVQSHLLSRRLAYFCCKKLSQICTDSSASLSSPSSQSPAAAAATSSASNEYVIQSVDIF